ncbi:hypothetical protein LN040_05445 [Desulfovibrio subterraneus]|uniref:hypothetical protein n=1 Tax=Desulfovibrio subterraneus TaxID=2718620 RepID=UPI0022B92ADA|nr:hypothetical protein [Desulfovibrio subterraneus]WBF68550.1 hypothetical protein LN040_05445 [Desulfovibrio subterraneus]
MAKDYDPPMHTTEHLLNQTMERMFGCGRCFSAHLNKKKSKCDYHFLRPLTDEEVKEIEKMVNTQLRLDLPVREEILDKAAAAARFNLGKLPDDSIRTIRIVHIGEYDACPCIGEHVANTAEIGTFSIISHDFADGILRLRFKLHDQ